MSVSKEIIRNRTTETSDKQSITIKKIFSF